MYEYLLLITCPILAISLCPGVYEGTPPAHEAPIPPLDQYNEALQNLNIEAVLNDIAILMRDSHECWPADEYGSFGASYGPLFIRLAWHCSGTFRDTDGVGGCSGGRQRFPPEASWDDNTNLDKARALLAPIKQKYGIALSWGDLMIFAGTTAIMNMGGPINDSICAGRIDSQNGALSASLGPGPDQPPCPTQGDCPPPLGTDTVGLIYVNPEGFMGDPTEPSRSAQQIREIFGRMNMDDRETVALIGGGHAFGKCHGACPLGPGDPPNDAPLNPWPGLCGTGKGSDTYTSGFEGQWTSNPLRWDNQFFILLNGDDDYFLEKGAGDKNQWRNGANPNLMMLTSDIALASDANYREIVAEFATDISALNDAFSGAWKKLTEDGGIWADEKKCIDPSKITFKYHNGTHFNETHKGY